MSMISHPFGTLEKQSTLVASFKLALDFIMLYHFLQKRKKPLGQAMIRKTPVKVTNFDISQKYGITNILINKKTRISSIDGPLTFNRIDTQNTTVELSTITTIMQGQLINIKATVRHLTGVK